MIGNIDLKTFYNCCVQEIYNNKDLYGLVLEKINNCEIYEDKGEPIIIKSWINTIDNIDTSMLLSDTNDIINKLIKSQDTTLYLLLITEITIILNNIFYSKYNSYKLFWINNTYNLYLGLIYNFQEIKKLKEIQQISPNIIDLNDYIHKFFLFMKNKCIKLGINIDINEYYL